LGNQERVIVTLIYLRKLCTLDVLADALGDVSRSPSATSSENCGPCSNKAATCHHREPPDTAPQPNSWPRQHLDSLRLHYARNLLSQVPKSAQPSVATLLRTVFEQPDTTAVHTQLKQVMNALDKKFPKAAEHLDAAQHDLLAFTAFPREIWRQIWSNNPQERLNKEIRRRTDVVGIFPDRTAVIRLVGAVLAEQNDEWTEARRYMGRDLLAKARLHPIESRNDDTALPTTLTA
ncbi:transposase, partial [Streptomyces sp. PA03-6a]|nr:transposase [Streptomyces sp. PA03-6a]